MADAAVLKEFLVRLGWSVDESAQRRFTDAMKGMTDLVTKLGLGMVAAAAGVVAAVSSMAGSSEQMYYTAKRIGDSVYDVERLAFAFSKLGLSPQEAIKNMTALGDALRNNPGMKSLFEAYAGTGNPTQQIEQFAKYYTSQGAEAQRVLREQFKSIFDTDFFLSLPRLAQSGGAGEQQYDLVSQLFPKADPDRIAAISRDYENAMRDLKLRTDKIGAEVQGAIVPMLTQSTKDLQDWLDKHAPQINSAIDSIEAHLQKAPPPVREFAAAVALLSGHMGDLGSTGLILAAILGPKFLGSIGAATGAVRGLVAAFPAWLIALDPVAMAGLGAYLGLTVGKAPIRSAEQEKEDMGHAPRGVREAGKDQPLGVQDPSKLLPKDRPGDALTGLEKTLWDILQYDPLKETMNWKRDPNYMGGTSTGGQQGGGGFWTRLWHELGIGSASAGEDDVRKLPGILTNLSQTVGDLNDTLTQQINAAGVTNWMHGLGAGAVGDAFGGGANSFGGGGGKAVNLNSPEMIERIKYLMSKGVSMMDAVALVSVAHSESGNNPLAVNPKSGARGEFQWLNTQGSPRASGLEAYAKEHDKDAKDWHTQYDYYLEEGKTTEARAFASLHNARSLNEKIRSLVTLDQRPGPDTGTETNRAIDVGNALVDNRGVTSQLYNNTNSNTDRSVQQTNNVNITTTADPDDVGRALENIHKRQAADILRHVNSPLTY